MVFPHTPGDLPACTGYANLKIFWDFSCRDLFLFIVFDPYRVLDPGLKGVAKSIEYPEHQGDKKRKSVDPPVLLP